MDTDRYQQTERTRVRRLPERAAYDRDTVHAILDEGFICHVGFVVDGRPFVIPTGYARVGETLYLHGSTGSRARPAAGDGRLRHRHPASTAWSWPARPSTTR